MKSIVSLIVPVYNVEKYLKKCLDSIENQTYTNLQVIIVNDGSTDNSQSVCEDYVKKNQKNWILINQENLGLSAARNTGIAYASGDYIAFLDSDDWLDVDFISTMVRFIENTGADIVESGIRWVYPNSHKDDVYHKNEIYNMKDALEYYLLQTKPIHSAVWCKLYNKKIFNNLNFAVGKLHEDGFFTYQAMYECKKYGLMNYIGYNYRQNREGSIMTQTVKSKNIIDVMEMMEKRINFFKQKKEDTLAEMAASYYYRTALTNYVTTVKVIKDYELAEEIKRKLKINRSNIFRNRYLGIKKIKFLYFYLFPQSFIKRY